MTGHSSVRLSVRASVGSWPDAEVDSTSANDRDGRVADVEVQLSMVSNERLLFVFKARV
jgi:hypothetical protein